MIAPVPLAFSCCILQIFSHCWWWKLTDTTKTTLTDWMRDLCASMTQVRLKCLFLVITIQMGRYIWTNWHTTAKQPTNSTQVSTVMLWNRADTCTSFNSALHRQQEWVWHDRRKFWQVMEDTKSVWISKQYNVKILQHFWTSGHGQSYCFVLRKSFLTIHTPWNTSY